MNAVLAIALNDLRLRSRRWITGLVVLVVVAITWQVIPATNASYALIVVDDNRMIYDSQTIAVGSVMFASLFFSLFAVFLVRGQSLNEIQNGVGSLLASVPVNNVRFLAGRWLGAMAYLISLVFIFMLTLFVLHALRGEAAIEVDVYLKIVFGTLLPLCAFAASMALFCDAIPWLQGRAGDVLYFLLWLAQMSLLSQMESIMSANPHLLALDGGGMVTLMSKVQMIEHSKNFNIGGSDFNAALTPITMDAGLWTSAMTWARVQAFFLMMTPLFFAMFFFHRYDPDKIRGSAGQKKISWWRRGNVVFRPLARYTATLFSHTVNLPTTLRIIVNEVLLSVVQNPSLPVLLLLCWILQSVSDLHAMDQAMALSLAVAGVYCADIGARHQQYFCDKMRNAIAGVNEWSIWQQFATVLFIIALFMLPSLFRFSELLSLRSIALPVGLILVSATAIVLALMTRSGKAFTVILLFALYVFLNAGAEPAIDLAGMHGSIDQTALLTHALLATGVLIVIECWRRWQR